MITAQAGDRLQAQWRLQTMSAGLRVVLADGDDTRARDAAPRLVDQGLTPVLVTSAGSAASGVEVLDPRDAGRSIDDLLDRVIERAASKRPMDASEREALRRDPLMVAVAAVRAGIADGCVAGAARPSADVARAALRVIGLAEGRTTLSSSFVMVMPDGRAMAYGDCAVVPEPDAMQLAEIAVATADTFAAVVGDQPRVAMLSFSTKGSAEHASVTVVREATRIAAQHRPDLAIDGELQFDAAIVPGVAAFKAPDSSVAGTANVFIFPNLSAGNIAYKITERLGGAQAYGPLFQGLAAPINDVSRGCSSTDILNISVITGLQALASKQDSAVGGE